MPCKCKDKADEQQLLELDEFKMSMWWFITQGPQLQPPLNEVDV